MTVNENNKSRAAYFDGKQTWLLFGHLAHDQPRNLINSFFCITDVSSLTRFERNCSITHLVMLLTDRHQPPKTDKADYIICLAEVSSG